CSTGCSRCFPVRGCWTCSRAAARSGWRPYRAAPARRCWSNAMHGWPNPCRPPSNACAPATGSWLRARMRWPCWTRRCRVVSTLFSSTRRSTLASGSRCWPRWRPGGPTTPGFTSNRRPTAGSSRAPAGGCTGKRAVVTRATPCTVWPAGALLHLAGLPTTARRAHHERGPHPHCGLSRHLRPDHQRARRPGEPCRAAVRAPGRRRRREPGQAPRAGAAAAGGPDARGAGAPSARGSARLRFPAGAFRPGNGRRHPAARAARGVGLRIRIPAGQHEPPPDPGGRDAVPHPGRAVRLHLVLAGARDLAPGRRRLGVRAAGRGQGAAGRVAADPGLSNTLQPPVQGSTMSTLTMKVRTRHALQALLVACLVLPFAACKKEEAPKQAVDVPVAVPTTDDTAAWRPYVSDVVRRNMGGITNQPYVYLLPAQSEGDFEGNYERLLEKAKLDVARGIISGNMLAYASPESAKMADIVIESF